MSSKIIDNLVSSAKNGSAIYQGNAINCNFTGNSANHGAIFEGNATGCNFTGNSAATGGAIYGSWRGDTQATNCNFNNNTAEEGGALIYGGAINCTFTNNIARNVAGAVNNAISAKFYRFKLTVDGVKIRDLIPCYRIIDNVIGLYDIVNNKFYIIH